MSAFPWPWRPPSAWNREILSNGNYWIGANFTWSGWRQHRQQHHVEPPKNEANQTYKRGFCQRLVLSDLYKKRKFHPASCWFAHTPVGQALATPHFHHWHHAAEPLAVDKNFAVHTPLWDWLFGTIYVPSRWPGEYGLCGEKDVPSGWLKQFAYPFKFLKSRSKTVGGLGKLET